MKLTIDQMLQQGLAAHNAGNLQEAERLYRTILEAEPAHPDANHNLGVMAVSLNKAELALPLFKTALDANPNIEQFWLSYIDALITRGHFEDSKRALKKGKKKGVSKENLKRLTQNLVSGEAENVRAQAPSQTDIQNLTNHYKNEQYVAAENLAMLITKQFPENQFAWKVLGGVFWQTGRKSEAVNANQKAVALSPQDPGAHNILGNTLKELGRLDEAEASYRQAIALKPDFTEAHSNLGNMLLELGRLEEAGASCRQAIALEPDFAAAHNNLGNALRELGRFGDAKASYRQAIALDPDYAEAHHNFGNMLNEQGKFEEAEASWSEAIALKPDYVEVHQDLGNMFNQLGRFEEAEESYRQAIALKADYAEAHNNLAYTLQELGRLEEAEESYRQAIALKPDYAEANYNLGATLQDLGRLEEAEASYTQAIALKSDFADAFWNLSGLEKTIRGAERWVDRCLIADANHWQARLTKAALRFYQGDRADFDNLIQSEFKKNSYMRSFSWVFSLPDLPELHFNKWHFFDAICKKTIISKPFYEFGVWRASSFKYLINVYKKGYGFDTFTGLPEDWIVGDRVEEKGTYSSDGNVPSIKGGEFIVGKFEDTLPEFFSESRPMASVINFDADLYSSTICALNFSKSVMDKDTILIFDEMMMNESWEQDEFKALNEFCSINQFSYKVIAISFFTKQVAVKLIGI